MNIVIVKKNGNADRDSCLALSLQMAIQTLGRGDVSKDEIYHIAECVGDGHLALPWGICKAGHEFGFCITHGSKNPYNLVDYNELMSKGGFNDAEARSFVSNLIQYCKNNNGTINLIKYPLMNKREFYVLMNGYIQFMEYVVKNEIGVVFVTLKWTQEENHTLPIKEFTLNEVVLVNCNEGQENEKIYNRSEFKEKWNDPATDNDFFILWKPKP